MSRTTLDVDIVIDPKPHILGTFLKELASSGFYISDATAKAALLARTQFNVIHMPSVWKIDLIIRKNGKIRRCVIATILEGGCHCGNIRYRYHSPLGLEVIPIRACGCSFCTKVRGRYTSHPQGRLEAEIKDSSQVNHYRFGTATADFVVCSRCGSTPFVISEIENHRYAVLNVNTFDGNPLGETPSATSDFDGETPETRLARRQKNWIAAVQIHQSGG